MYILKNMYVLYIIYNIMYKFVNKRKELENKINKKKFE